MMESALYPNGGPRKSTDPITESLNPRIQQADDSLASDIKAATQVSRLEMRIESLESRNKRLSGALRLAQQQRDNVARSMSEQFERLRKTAAKSKRRHKALRGLNRAVRLAQVEAAIALHEARTYRKLYEEMVALSRQERDAIVPEQLRERESRYE